MRDFGVELEAVDRQGGVADGRERASRRAGERGEVGGDVVDLIAVAHPHLGRRRHPGEHRVGRGDLAGRTTVLTRRRPADPTTEGIAGQLHPVADPEDGDAEAKEPRIAARRPFLVDARRTAGEDDSARGDVADPVRRQVMADDLAEDVLLADPPGNELCVLRAEIENDDPLRTGRDGLGGGSGRELRHGGAAWGGSGKVREYRCWTERCPN